MCDHLKCPSISFRSFNASEVHPPQFLHFKHHLWCISDTSRAICASCDDLRSINPPQFLHSNHHCLRFVSDFLPEACLQSCHTFSMWTSCDLHLSFWDHPLQQNQQKCLCLILHRTSMICLKNGNGCCWFSWPPAWPGPWSRPATFRHLFILRSITNATKIGHDKYIYLTQGIY